MDTSREDDQPTAKESTLTSANEAHFAVRFEPVRELLLDEGASLVARENLELKADELWQGDAYDVNAPTSSTIPVYIRVGTSDALISELLCGCIARALGLPAPEVFLIYVRPGYLSGSRLANSTKTTLCVGTRDIGGQSFAQFLSRDEGAALPLLREWTALNQVIAFDEWVANPDRNLGNLIYVSQALHIIDHADAFGGSARQLYPLTELIETTFENKLAGVLSAFRPSHRNQVLEQIKDWIKTTAATLELRQIVYSVDATPWQTPEQHDQLIDFLTQRLSITHALLCQRFGHPQLRLDRGNS